MARRGGTRPRSAASSACAVLARITDGGPIPVRYACDGQDLSPPLVWSGAPPGTRSFVLLCDDPDAPAGVWHHWALFDVPANVSKIEEGTPSREMAGAFRQALNDFGRFGYGGPCPPPDRGASGGRDDGAGPRSIEVTNAHRAAGGLFFGMGRESDQGDAGVQGIGSAVVDVRPATTSSSSPARPPHSTKNVAADELTYVPWPHGPP